MPSRQQSIVVADYDMGAKFPDSYLLWDWEADEMEIGLARTPEQEEAPVDDGTSFSAFTGVFRQV